MIVLVFVCAKLQIFIVISPYYTRNFISNLSEYYCRASREIEFQPFFMVFHIHRIVIGEVHDRVISKAITTKFLGILNGLTSLVRAMAGRISMHVVSGTLWIIKTSAITGWVTSIARCWRLSRVRRISRIHQ